MSPKYPVMWLYRDPKIPVIFPNPFPLMTGPATTSTMPAYSTRFVTPSTASAIPAKTTHQVISSQNASRNCPRFSFPTR